MIRLFSKVIDAKFIRIRVLNLKDMYSKIFKYSLPFLFLFPFCFLFSKTIEEKEMQLLQDFESKKGDSFTESLIVHNQNLKHLKEQLKEKYETIYRLQKEAAEEKEYQTLLQDVNVIKNQIENLHNSWRKQSAMELNREEELYAFWDQEETTLSELIMEYGSSDHLYVIPQQLANMKLHMHSMIPVPREAWGELLEIILSQNGIGIKSLNPYTKQLYVLKQDLMAVEMITNKRDHLSALANSARVAFIFTPNPEQLKTVTYFLERFRDPKRTFIYQVGTKIVIISTKDEAQKLLSLYDAVWEKECEKISKVLTLRKIPAIEMEKILKAFFCDEGAQNRLALVKGGEALSIFALKEENTLILVGPKQLVDKAQEVVEETEGQINDPSEMTVYWYTCKHSEPIDVADVLEKVYTSLVHIKLDEGETMPPEEKPCVPEEERKLCTYGPPPTPPHIHPPVVVAGTVKSQIQKSTTLNFIPYPKTGAIMMVVRKDTLEKIKELLKKIDVPKRMVEIEVLLFEKKLHRQDNFGLNMLRIGSPAENVHRTGVTFNDPNVSKAQGIFQFFIQRPKYKNWPAFDIFYNFLMTQEDIQINASPSVTTINQVPATISIVEEISINNGAAPLETQTGITFEKSFSRAQYGTTIVITPTVHEPDIEPDSPYFITLETNVTFDTTKSDINDRPNVNRRHIENTVRVLDGETLILGGLRKKNIEDRSEKVPFLGEVPGLGKLFGFTRLHDQLTEMFIFITPKIIFDPKESLIQIRNEELKKRAGDLPEFLVRIEECKKRKKEKTFQRSWNLVFGNNYE